MSVQSLPAMMSADAAPASRRARAPLHRRVLHAARRHVRDRVEARRLEHGAGRLDGREVLVLGVDEVHEDRARGARSRFCQFRVACCLPWSDLDRCVPAELPQALTGRGERSYSTYRNERCSAAHEGQGWHCCWHLHCTAVL